MEVYGADISGIEGELIRFTAIINENRRGVALLGLAQKVVKEGYVRAAKAIEMLDGDWSRALTNQGYTIQLSPAETPKTSSGLDLPIAITLLQASILQNQDTLQSQIEDLEKKYEKADGPKANPDKKKRLLEQIESLISQRKLVLKYRKRFKDNKRKYLLIGELDIATGQIKTPQFAMFGMIAAAKPGFTVIVPEESEVHAYIVATRHKNITALKASDLQEVWNIILGVARPRKATRARMKLVSKRATRYIPDLRDIDGVSLGKRAITVALAGGHNILLVGPTGTGKTMLASAAPALLPDLNADEIFELNKIYSAKGDLKENEVLNNRPFREAQSGGITQAAMFGGGNYRLLPGEISLAHKGVLLLDEINLCKSSLIEQLRNTLNDHVHRVQRVRGTVEYPCNFILVAAMNPCKCGWFGHYQCPECNQTFFSPNAKCPRHPTAVLRSKCKCSRREIDSYRNKLSAPMLDRIDLKVLVSDYDEMQTDASSYASSTIRRQIKQARELQRARYSKAIFGDSNAHVPDRAQFDKFTAPMEQRVDAYLREVFRELDLTKRMKVKLRLVARTIADLEESRGIRVKDIKEAVDLMGLDHDYFRSLSK